MFWTNKSLYFSYREPNHHIHNCKLMGCEVVPSSNPESEQSFGSVFSQDTECCIDDFRKYQVNINGMEMFEYLVYLFEYKNQNW